jgi:hypothetical protein
MKSNKFKLSHLTLYAKGWYENTDDVWGDLKKVLELDDYSPFTKNDIYSIICSRFSEFDIRQSELKEVLYGIHPSTCWKYGYYTKGCDWVKDEGVLPEYDMPTAFIYYVLSTLRFIDNSKWDVVTPKYSKMKKPKEITTKRVIEQFNKKVFVESK